MDERRARVLVVLGCAIRRRAAAGLASSSAPSRALCGAAGRRVLEAAAEHARMLRAGLPADGAEGASGGAAGGERADAAVVVIASGGRKWDDGPGVVVEADALRDALVEAGVPASAIVRERCSFSTRENARYVARLVRGRAIDEVTLVTSAWHMRRAAALFRAEGLRVREVPAEDAPMGGCARRLVVWAWRAIRERASAWKDGVA